MSELARKLGIKGRAYQKAKRQLVEHGYMHERRSQGEGGRWLTEQLVANNPLTSEQAGLLLRGTAPTATATAAATAVATVPPPSTQLPTVGEPAPRAVGGYEPVEDHSDKTTPHPPSEPEPATVPTPGPTPQTTTADPAQLARAERVLLSLRHTRRELFLGVREARALAVEAVKWLERGLSESDLRHALLAERPREGVRSAVGFLRHRLIQKLPEPPARHQPYERPPLPELVECTGPGEPHVFRPLFGESECPSCYRAAARTEPEPVPWRERIARINGTPTALPAEV
ncbi:hypothetical protein [Streptomyces sp. NPDC001880]